MVVPTDRVVKMPVVAPIVATAVLLLVHIPPGTVPDMVPVVPRQRPVGPVITPADVTDMTLTIWVAYAVPHDPVTA